LLRLGLGGWTPPYWKIIHRPHHSGAP
jgi:hypothetical protein